MSAHDNRAAETWAARVKTRGEHYAPVVLDDALIELRAARDVAQQAFTLAQNAYHEALKARSPVQPGDFLVDRKRRKAIVTRLEIFVDERVYAWGALMRVDGSRQSREFRLWQHDEWTPEKKT